VFKFLPSKIYSGTSGFPDNGPWAPGREKGDRSRLRSDMALHRDVVVVFAESAAYVAWADLQAAQRPVGYAGKNPKRLAAIRQPS
jgi:hypothetical protein